MRALASRAILMLCSGLTMSCERQSASFEPTDTSPLPISKLVPSNRAALVTRGPTTFSLGTVDVEHGLTASVATEPFVLNCGPAAPSGQADLFQVVTPNGVEHSRLLGRNLSVAIWLEPFADTCSLPFAVGRASATLVSKDLANVGRGATVLSWHVRGSVSAIESGERYQLVITIHQVLTPDGTLRADRGEIKLIPVGH